MNNDKLKAFLNNGSKNAPIISPDNKFDNEEIIESRQGLIERVDRTLKTKDGRILLMEQR
jgi:hypothetical protein